MALPYVKISFANGAISTVTPSAERVAGMMVSAVANGDFALSKAYQIYHLSEAEDLGITAEKNAFAHEQIRQFYAEAGEGAELWVYGLAKTVKPSVAIKADGDYAKDFIQSAKGRLRTIAVCWDDSSATLTATNGLDSDVLTAAKNAQETAEWATTSMFAPLFVVLNGYGYTHATASSMTDLKTLKYNRVGVFVGSVESTSTMGLGLLLGKISGVDVQTHIGRVKDGALNVEKAYIGEKAAEVGASETLNTLGYITFRTFVGKSGYFFSDDHLATADTDDYHTICNRRVIDKAYRVCYDTLLEKVNDEIPVTDDGLLPTSICHSLQGMINTAIMNNMTAYGNLGVDPEDDSDTGVECYVDPNQKVVDTSTIKVSIKVKPYGYARYIEATLGFMTV